MPKRIYPQASIDRQAVPLTANELNRFEVLLAQLRETAEEIRQLNREGHELLKDLRAERVKAQRVLPMIVAKRIDKEVTTQIERLGEETKEAMEQSVKKVYAQFDEVKAMLMGEDEPGKPSLLEMLDNLSPILPLIEAIINGRFRVGDIRVSDRKTGVVDADLSTVSSEEDDLEPREQTSKEQEKLDLLLDLNRLI